MALPYQREKQFIYHLGLCHQVAVVDSLSPNQKAEIVLDADSGFLENATTIREVLTNVIESSDDEELNQFCQAFATIAKQVNA